MPAVPPHLYTQRGIELGHDADVVARANAERLRQSQRGITPILTLGHLAHRTGVSYRYLREIAQRRRDPYIDIKRVKRDGNIRSISSPDPPLMEAQRWILHNALSGLRLHPACYGYRAGRSATECAGQHLGARWLVKLDLHNFFGTVDERRVYHVFRDLGYAALISFELARVCTRLGALSSGFRRRSSRYEAIPSYSVAARGWLPQGAPTSGALANAVATRLDERLADVARDHGWTYTRYSDDMTFSSSQQLDRAVAVRLIKQVTAAVREEHFVLHTRKTRVVPPGARHVVLGLLVGGSRLELMPEYKRRVEVHVRGVERFGLAGHASHRGFRSILSLVNHVDGCLAFAVSVDSTWAGRMRSRWEGALTQSGMP